MKLLKVALTGAVLVAAVNALEEKPAKSEAHKARRKEVKKEARKVERKRAEKQAQIEKFEFDPVKILDAKYKKKLRKREKKTEDEEEPQRVPCSEPLPEDLEGLVPGHSWDDYENGKLLKSRPPQWKAECANGVDNVIHLRCSRDGNWVLFDYNKKHKDFDLDAIVKKNSKNGRCDLSKEDFESLKAPKKNKSKADAVFNAEGFEAELEAPEREFDCRSDRGAYECKLSGGRCEQGICQRPCKEFSTWNGRVCRCDRGLVSNRGGNYCKPFDERCECVSPACPENSSYDYKRRVCNCDEGFWNLLDNAPYCKLYQHDCKCEEKPVIEDPEVPECPENSVFHKKSGYCICKAPLYSVLLLPDGNHRITKYCKPEEEDCVCKRLNFRCEGGSYFDRRTLKCECKEGYEFDENKRCVRIEDVDEEDDDCICPLYTRPVCAKNRDGTYEEYQNSCFAQCDGRQIYKLGKCPKPDEEVDEEEKPEEDEEEKPEEEPEKEPVEEESKEDKVEGFKARSYGYGGYGRGYGGYGGYHGRGYGYD